MDALTHIFDNLNFFEASVPQANRSVLSNCYDLLLFVEDIKLENLTLVCIDPIHYALSVWIDQNQFTFCPTCGH